MKSIRPLWHVSIVRPLGWPTGTSFRVSNPGSYAQRTSSGGTSQEIAPNRSEYIGEPIAHQQPAVDEVTFHRCEVLVAWFCLMALRCCSGSIRHDRPGSKRSRSRYHRRGGDILFHSEICSTVKCDSSKKDGFVFTQPPLAGEPSGSLGEASAKQRTGPQEANGGQSAVIADKSLETYALTAGSTAQMLVTCANVGGYVRAG